MPALLTQCHLCVSAKHTATPLTGLQVKALTSLEVARQRQANRAQLHVGLPAQSQGPFSRQPAGQVQARGQLQAAGQSQPFKLPRVASRFDPAQQARAKLDAIRNELGKLQPCYQLAASHFERFMTRPCSFVQATLVHVLASSVASVASPTCSCSPAHAKPSVSYASTLCIWPVCQRLMPSQHRTIFVLASLTTLAMMASKASF